MWELKAKYRRKGLDNDVGKSWDRNVNSNRRMGLILKVNINHHLLYITTNTVFTYQQSTMVSNSGRSIIDLTLTCGLKNIKVVFETIIDQQANKWTELIVDSATSLFVVLTEISNKMAKGWWNKNIKAARKEIKSESAARVCEKL